MMGKEISRISREKFVRRGVPVNEELSAGGRPRTNWLAYHIDSKVDRLYFPKRTGRSKSMSLATRLRSTSQRLIFRIREAVDIRAVFVKDRRIDGAEGAEKTEPLGSLTYDNQKS